MHTSPPARAALMAATSAVVVLLGCSAGPIATDPDVEMQQPEITHDDDGETGPEPQTGAGDAAAGQGDEPAPEEFIAELTMVAAPVEMNRDDDVGATAAAEYFLFAYTYAYGTGDTGPLEQMAAPECGFCASVVSGAQQAHAGDTYMRSGDPVITAVQVGQAEEEGVDYLVWLAAQLPQMRTFDADHTVVEIHPAGDIEAGLAMAHSGGSWVVRGATFEAGS